MKLRYMSPGLLAMFAGGNPWKVNATLQSGRPAQIAGLGQAFHNAGQSTQAADNAFAEARRRLDAWINDNGQHPINDSNEVQRTATSLGLQTAQLPKIAVDMENIAGALAQAQGTANGYIATLESRLQTLDEWIGQAEDLIKQDQNLLAQVDDADDISELEDDIARLEQYISDCEHEAIDDTKATLQQVEHVREGYSGELQKAEANLRTDGYDPAAIQTLDGEHTKDRVASDIPPSDNRTPTLQDMLLPGGAGPGGAVPQGPPIPAGRGADSAGKPPSLQDLLLPTEKADPSGPGDQQPVPGSLPDLLSRLQQPGAPGAPPPQLKPADVESFKAMVRKTMALDGVPPDQIEARLDEMVSRTQQWIDNGMPNYVPPEPQPLPPPGFGEGFGDRWFATEQGIKNLIGQGGPGAPGVLESWEQMLKGTTEIVQNPLGAVTGEVKDAFDSPSAAYYLGAKASDGAFTLPGLLFGGEGAAVGEVGDIGAATRLAHNLPGTHPPLSPIEHALPSAIDHTPTHIPLPDYQSVPIGLDHPGTYHPQAPQAAFDLNDAFLHGQPTTNLTHQVADMTTHDVGGVDRVVLGKWQGQEGGYIGEARADGGIYFDTGDETWNAITHGLTESQKMDLGWQVNEQFLRRQMENHVGRIDYILPDGFDSVDEVARIRRESFSALEINFLDQNAAKFGYKRIGNAWVYEGG